MQVQTSICPSTKRREVVRQHSVRGRGTTLSSKNYVMPVIVLRLPSLSLLDPPPPTVPPPNIPILRGKDMAADVLVIALLDASCRARMPAVLGCLTAVWPLDLTKTRKNVSWILPEPKSLYISYNPPVLLSPFRLWSCRNSSTTATWTKPEMAFGPEARS